MVGRRAARVVVGGEAGGGKARGPPSRGGATAPGGAGGARGRARPRPTGATGVAAGTEEGKAGKICDFIKE